MDIYKIFQDLLKEKEMKDFFSYILSEFTHDCLSHLGEMTEENIENIIPEDVYKTYLPSVFEFFIGNKYPYLGEDYSYINKILREKNFTKKEKEFLNGMKNSYMDLYEVVDVIPNEQIVFRSLLESKVPHVTVKEKKGSHALKKGDYLGARVIHLTTHNELSSIALVISKDTAKSIVHIVKKMNKGMYAMLDQFKKEDDEAELTIKKMWCKEIIGLWLKEALEKHNAPICNVDGDILDFISMRYPIKKGSKKILITLLAEKNELQFIDIYEREYQWVWLDKEKQDRYKKIKFPKNAKIISSSISSADGHQYNYIADIRLNDKFLIFQVDSEKRCNILKNYIDLYFSEYLEKGEYYDPI